VGDWLKTIGSLLAAAVVGLFVVAYYVAVAAVSLAVPVAIVWAIYRVVMHFT
jgi:hypothetical protein